MKKLNNSGETIVEVIISVAVVGAVLAGAYYLIDRSYRQNQAAIERVAGLKAAESKLETLRTFSKNKLAGLSLIGQYCVASDKLVVSSDSESNCKIDRYKVTVTKDYGTFAIKSEWDSLLQDKENLTLYYRP